jgi:hypothetical protein
MRRKEVQMSNRLRPAIAVAVVVLFTVSALAACGGEGGSGGVASLGGSNGSDGDGTTTSEDPEDAALAFVKCMREHGVDMPDPDAGGGIRLTARPGENAKVERAQEACQPLLQKAAPKLSADQQAAMQDAALAFAKCMREHGVDMPDPTFGKGGIVMQKRSRGDSEFDPDDAKFKAAQKACQPIVENAARKAGLPPPEQRMNGSGGDDS